jgi:hypothetical protein
MTMDSTSGCKLWRLSLRFFLSISTKWHSRRCCRVSRACCVLIGAGSRLHRANTISPPSLGPRRHILRWLQGVTSLRMRGRSGAAKVAGGNIASSRRSEPIPGWECGCVNRPTIQLPAAVITLGKRYEDYVPPSKAHVLWHLAVFPRVRP